MNIPFTFQFTNLLSLDYKKTKVSKVSKDCNISFFTASRGNSNSGDWIKMEA
mgnify:CR=1 FL=1